VRRALPLAALALAAAPAGAHAAERVVDMPAKYFVPPNITTLAGDTVTWTNSDTVEHDVASIGVGFDSGIISPGGRYSQTFGRPGHYAYRCTIHAFMVGTVDVYSFQLLGPDHPISIGRRRQRGVRQFVRRAEVIDARQRDLTRHRTPPRA